MSKKVYSGRNNIRHQFLILVICGSVLALLIIQFIYIRKLDSTHLKSEINRVETTLKSEQSQLIKQVQLHENKLDSIKKLLNTIKNDSTESKKYSEIEKQFDDASYTNWALWLAFGLTWLVLIVLFFIFLKKIFHQIGLEGEKIINTVLESNKNTDKFILNDPSKLQQSIKRIEDDVTTLKNHIKELKNKVNSEEEKTKPEDDAKFFKSAKDKILTGVLENSTDALFKVFNLRGNEAEFEYCGGVVNIDIFTEVCIFENNPLNVPNITKITTTIPGKVKKINDNNWQVTTKANIKFQ